jgi:hypothetical protein
MLIIGDKKRMWSEVANNFNQFLDRFRPSVEKGNKEGLKHLIIIGNLIILIYYKFIYIHVHVHICIYTCI